MRKVSEKCRRALSAILAAAMVLTSAPGTTMTAMAAEQTDAFETVAGSEVNAVDNEASLDGGEKTALEGEGDAGEEEPTVTKLDKPEFILEPSDGNVANGGEASFTLRVPENSEVKYVIGDADQTAAAVADPTEDSETYIEASVVVPAPESEAETTVVVKAVAFPAGDNAASYTRSDVASATFTFAAKQTEEPVEPVVVAAPTITFKNGEDTLENGASVPFGTEVSLELGTEGTETVIYYTTDGTEPSEDSDVYGEAIPLSSENEAGETVTVKAIAVADGNRSEVATASIVFEAKAPAEAPAAPAITLKNGDAVLESGATVAYGTKVSMELAAQENAAIYYTVDGTNPTTDSSAYTKAVELSSDKEDGETVTVKAVAVADGMTSTVAETSVTFEASVKTVKVGFEGDWNQFTCKFVSADSDKSARWEDDSIVANQNSKLRIQITAQEGFKLKSVLLGGKSQKIVNGMADFRLTAAKDTTITVNTEGILGYTIYDSEGLGLWPKTNGVMTYAISPIADYKIVAKEGTDEVVFEEAKLTLNNKAYTGKSSVTLAEDGKAAVLSVGTDLAGKTCKVVLKHGEHNSTLTFEVAPILTTVTVAGVKSGVLTQTMGETKSYALTLNPKNSKDEIKAKYEDKAGVIEELTITDGKLSIKTAKAESKAKITLYNKTTLDKMGEDEQTRKDATLCTFTLEVAAPAWTNQKPTVKQIGATDTDIILKITAPKGVTLDDTYFYEIKSEGETFSGNSIEETKRDAYRSATEEEFRVTVGKQSMWMKDYTVNVKLLMSRNNYSSDDVVCYSQTTTLTCSTKKPYYADKISLKKATTTVYSGQENVHVATIDFGKNTTYIDDAQVEVIGKPDAGSIGLRGAVDAEIDPAGSRVYVSVADETIPGKYTIKVTAKAEDGMIPATATLPITVVAGANDIRAVGSTQNILITNKANGKANITVGYGRYNSLYKPKSAKFTYTLGKIVDGLYVEDAFPLGKNSRNKGIVTISNKGAITVDKSYVINTEDESANTFAVLVTANDYKGNDAFSIVKFTVVKEAQKLGRLVLLGEDDTVVLDGAKNEICASSLENAHVAVLKTAEAVVGTDGKYNEDDIVDSGLYTVSVKGKGITADKAGKLTVTSPTANNITITATATDGGKQTASLKIGKLTYDDVSGKNVRPRWVYYTDTEAIRTDLKADAENAENELVAGKEALTEGATLEFQIVFDDLNGDPVTVTKFQNYSISVSGGAKVLKDCAAEDPMLAKNQVLQVQLTDVTKPVKVTLKNGSQKTVYTLPYADEVKESILDAPVVKLDPKQTLVAGKQENQKLTFTVTNKMEIPEYAMFAMVGADGRAQEFLRDAIDEIEYADKKITVVFENGMPETAGSASVYFVMCVPGPEENVTYSKLSKPVKITAVQMKKSFKLVENYKMSAVDASNVPIAYKGTGVNDVTVKKLYNANVQGKMNDFTDVIVIGADGESLELKQRISDRKLTGYAEIEVTYDDYKQEVITSRITVTIPKEGASVNSYKAADVTLVKGKTTVAEAEKMPVVIKAGKNEAEVAQAVMTDAIDGIKVAGVEDGKVYLNVKNFVDAHKKDKRNIKQAVELKVVLAGANDQDTEVTDNKNAITLKVNVVVPKEMLFEEERAELTPTIKFSNETPENRADDVTFTIEVKDVKPNLIKGIYYTTDGTDPALDANGKPQFSTKKYVKEGTIPVEDWDVAVTVMVKVLVVAKDQVNYKNTTGSSSVTFKAAEPTALTAPKITFSNALPKNRESITFTIETQAAEKDYIKGVYYTTDESEPALDGDGNPTGTTQEYNGTEATLTGPAVDGEKLVWVKVLVVAKDKATHTDVTNSATVTFAAKTTESGDTGSGDTGDGSEIGN